MCVSVPDFVNVFYLIIMLSAYSLRNYLTRNSISKPKFMIINDFFLGLSKKILHIYFLIHKLLSKRVILFH